MQSLAIAAKKREGLGKRASKLSRREDAIPCVLYGGEETIHFTTTANALRGLIYTDQFMKVALEVEGKTYDCILKAIQFHPVTDRILHVDFLELKAGVKVITSVPVKLSGFAAGVQEGGRLDLKMRKLRIKCLPKDLIEAVELDVTNLELGKSIKVRDISLPEIEIMNSAGSPVAQVSIPRALRGGGGAEEEEGEEGAEGGEAAAGEGGGDAPAAESSEGSSEE